MNHEMNSRRVEACGVGCGRCGSTSVSSCGVVVGQCVRGRSEQQSHVTFRRVFNILVNGSSGTIKSKHLHAGNSTLL